MVPPVLLRLFLSAIEVVAEVAVVEGVMLAIEASIAMTASAAVVAVVVDVAYG